jgi:hypothetical protein
MFIAVALDKLIAWIDKGSCAVLPITKPH